MKTLCATLAGMAMLSMVVTPSFGEQGKTMTEPGQLDMTGSQGIPPKQYAIVPVERGTAKEVTDNPFLDATVKNPEGKKLGTLDKLIMDTKTGKIEYGIVSLEGTDRLVPVQWSAFQVNRESGRVVLNATKDQLQPALSPDDTKDLSPDIKKYFDQIIQQPMTQR